MMAVKIPYEGMRERRCWGDAMGVVGFDVGYGRCRKRCRECQRCGGLAGESFVVEGWGGGESCVLFLEGFAEVEPVLRELARGVGPKGRQMRWSVRWPKRGKWGGGGGLGRGVGGVMQMIQVGV